MRIRRKLLVAGALALAAAVTAVTVVTVVTAAGAGTTAPPGQDAGRENVLPGLSAQQLAGGFRPG